ncbi:MAG: tRNA (uridine(34)/cytosine(34)/5-carboxymethylaminomethyluridine(34)-2'-O)-methyltransferase TrmL [Bacilli bacterium]
MINVVLYNPEIPQNTGNIIRTCAGTNAKLHLIKPLGFSLDEKNVKRSAVNHIEDVEMIIYEDWNEFLTKNKGIFYFITRYGKKPHSSYDYSNIEENIYFIFGSESSGLPKEIMRTELDNCLRIPMSNKIRSLNLSNCVTMVVYEALRQQNYYNLYFEEQFKSSNFIIED